MTAVDEIQAAIDKLTQAKGLIDTPLVRWRDQERIPGWDGFIVLGDDVEDGDECNPVARVYTEELADMLVTLHATIDAQLAILHSVYNARGIERKWDSLIYVSDAVDLARAINGGTN